MYTVLGLFTCHNRCVKTKRCVESLLGDARISWSFIAVDDNSTDGTGDFLKSKKEITIVKGDGNLYYSGGMRVAIKAAKNRMFQNKYDYVLLLNDDVIFYQGAISRLIDILENEQAIMVGTTENKYGECTYGGVIKKSNWAPRYEHVMLEGKKVKCDTFNANCVLIPSEIFMILDNIDPVYVHGFGDYDYGFAASRRGIAIYTSDFAVGLCEHDHFKEDTWEDPGLPRRKRLELKERVLGHPWKIWFYFLKKNYGLGTAVLYTINDYMKILLRRN